MQQEFFNILEEFFHRATGSSAEDFATLDSFSEAIRKNADKLSKRGESAWQWGVNALHDYYQRHQFDNFASAKSYGGMKLVLGGGSRFLTTQLEAVRKMLLYADTILIPDPVYPWLEVERTEEKFRHVNMLQNAFTLLHLKPLVDADLTYPAIFVFQSWEKGLEKHDKTTNAGIENLVTNFFSHYTRTKFADVTEVLEYARGSESEFLQSVETNRLFVAPEGYPGQRIVEAIKQYRDNMNVWRSPEALKVYGNLTDGELVWNGIYERLGPQWHLLENADELNSQPMLCLESHWHYYSLCVKMFEGRLLEEKLLRPETVSTLRALNDTRFEWLGNVPIKALVELRQRNENEEFRNRIKGFTSALHESTIEDIDRVAAEVGRGIAALLSDHKKKVRAIREKYEQSYAKLAVAGLGAWITLAATFMPSLAPFLSAIPALGLAGKYALDKTGEMVEKRQASRSLTGVLATAHESSNPTS
jgi:hypothetical protein